MTVLTERFTRAVAYARIAHPGRVRKGTGIQYATRLLRIAVKGIRAPAAFDETVGRMHAIAGPICSPQPRR